MMYIVIYFIERLSANGGPNVEFKYYFDHIWNVWWIERETSL